MGLPTIGVLFCFFFFWGGGVRILRTVLLWGVVSGSTKGTLYFGECPILNTHTHTSSQVLKDPGRDIIPTPEIHRIATIRFEEQEMLDGLYRLRASGCMLGFGVWGLGFGV